MPQQWNERYLHNWFFCFCSCWFYWVFCNVSKNCVFLVFMLLVSSKRNDFRELDRWDLISPKRPNMNSTLPSWTISLFSTNSILPMSLLDTENSTKESLSFLINQQAFSGYNKEKNRPQNAVSSTAFSKDTVRSLKTNSLVIVQKHSLRFNKHIKVYPINHNHSL